LGGVILLLDLESGDRVETEIGTTGLISLPSPSTGTVSVKLQRKNLVYLPSIRFGYSAGIIIMFL
jgi:hypothetical protein